jgi:hypothetical protein
MGGRKKFVNGRRVEFFHAQIGFQILVWLRVGAGKIWIDILRHLGQCEQGVLGLSYSCSTYMQLLYQSLLDTDRLSIVQSSGEISMVKNKRLDEAAHCEALQPIEPQPP